jgi:hypothetical protein
MTQNCQFPYERDISGIHPKLAALIRTRMSRQDACLGASENG